MWIIMMNSVENHPGSGRFLIIFSFCARLERILKEGFFLLRMEYLQEVRFYPRIIHILYTGRCFAP